MYREPVVVDGKTIPVAKVAYGFGGGTGAKKAPAGKNGTASAATEGSEGAGGGVAAKPVGVVEISRQEH